MSAAVLGDERMLQTLLRHTGLPLDFALPGTHRRTLLWNAATAGRLDVVDYLAGLVSTAQLSLKDSSASPFTTNKKTPHFPWSNLKLKKVDSHTSFTTPP